MANVTSVEFEGVKCTNISIQEANGLSTDANENTDALGLFIQPSENVPGRPNDITGYSLVSANSQGKLEWSNPLITGTQAKQPVRVASTVDIDLSLLVTIIDTIVLNEGDRVLVKDQTDTTQNGIYEVENGFLVRTEDAALGIISEGAYTVVTEGANNFETLWVCPDYDSVFGEPITFGLIRGATSGALPAPLQSIADLTTVSNEMLYTTAPDTYATTALTVVGRSLLLQPTVATQRSQLGLEIGTDVQAFSNVLTDVVSIAGTADRLIYTVGGSYSGTAVSAFVRANVLPAPDAATLSSNLGYIVGPVSTVNRLVKVSASNTVSETALSIDASDNLTGVNDITANGDIATTTGTINNVTTAEFTQLANIDSTTISSTQWGFLGAMDQGISTTNTPTFNGLSAGSQKITAVLSPTNAQDAANKTYVDTVASTGASPLIAANYGTAALLPNTPTYASPAETLTSTTAPGSLTIDGQTMSIGDRVLVKDQADNRENGVYDVTDDGATPGPNWVLTRSSDFNQAAMPISVGTSIFVEIVSGASQSGSTWSLNATINDVDPLTDAVVWIQIGGSPTFTAGLGIDAVQLAGGTIQTDISARLIYTGNDLDLNTVTVPYGGTGLTTITSGNVMVGQGAAAIIATKAAPTGDFVGTTDTQTLTNKTITASTNNVTTRGIFSNSGSNTVSTFAAANPTSGQVLTATGATTATWQDPTGGVTTFTNTLTVSPSNPDVSPNWTTLGAAITDAISLTPTETNQVLIVMYPGTYSETTPLTIPEWVSISGRISSQGVVTICPAAPAAVGAVLVLNGNVRLYGIVVDGFDGVAANATIGVSSIGGSLGSVDNCKDVTARNCTDAAFRVSGTGAQFSKILICTSCSGLVTQGFPFVMSTGFDCRLGAVLRGSGINASGFLSGGGELTIGLNCINDFSFMDVSNVGISSVTNGLNVGTGVSSNNSADYAFLRTQGCTVGFYTTAGLLLNSKSSVQLFGFYLEDDTGLFPTSNDVIVTNPSAPSDPNIFFVFGSTFLIKRIVFAGDLTNPFRASGVVSDTTVGSERTLFLGDLSTDQDGTNFSMGQGSPNNTAMVVWSDDGGVFTNITSQISDVQTNPFLCDLASTGSIDLASAPATIDGIAPTVGVSRVLVKDGSTANPGTTSVDNGIYIWNGTGVAMTRAADFLAGAIFPHYTFFSVDVGTVSYGSRWKIDASTYAASNITVATTAWGVQAYSSPMFPVTTYANDDVLYIGSAAFRVFPGVEIALTAPLTTSAGTAIDVLEWEFFNGATWEPQSLMSTNEQPPYTSFANETGGFGETFAQYETKMYNYRFGDQSGWAPTTVNTVLGFWVRARITDAASITQVPIISTLRFITNSKKVNELGFTEYFGQGRSKKKISMYTNNMVQTSIGNPGNQTIDAADNGTILIEQNLIDNTLTAAGTIGFGSHMHMPNNIDTSFPFTMKVFYTTAAAGAGDVAFQVDYTLTTGTDLIGPGGTPSATPLSTGIVTSTVSGTSGQQQFVTFDLDINSYIPDDNIFWFQYSRQGGNVADTYGSSIYVLLVTFEYVSWNKGIPA